MQVIWSPAALTDVQRIYEYIAEFNPMAASGLVKSLIAAGDSLVTFPHRGRPAADNLRELTLVNPYIIRYEVIDDQVHILRVRHGMRRA